MKKSKYLLEAKGKGAIIEVDPKEITSGDWGQLQEFFYLQAVTHKREKDRRLWWVGTWHLRDHDSKDGVYWHSELANIDGASFMLFQMPDHTDEQIERVKQHIYRTDDVVRMQVLRIKELIEFTWPELKHERVQL